MNYSTVSEFCEDPAQGNLPEVIEEYLEHGVMKCIAFNRRGTLLAAGCSNGSCIIWDFETRVVAKELRDKACTAAITSVCWSKNGHYILISAADKTLILWDVFTVVKVAHIELGKPALHAHLHPGSLSPSLCLVNPICSAPLIVDLKLGTITSLPISLPNSGDGLCLPVQGNFSDNSPSQYPACFNKHGDLVYLGNSKGEILLIEHRSIQVFAVVSVAGGAVIKNIVLSTNGQFLLVYSSDRTMKVYENTLPVKDGVKSLHKMGETLTDLRGIEKLKAIGSKSLVLYHEFQDTISRYPCKSACFSRNGEWIVSGSAGKGEHKICIWSKTGHLSKTLEGPEEALIDLVWHPLHPIIVSLSITGLVFIWARIYTENWSAFSPNFKEIEVCEEYVEREDEFDIMPETHKVKHSAFVPDEEVDIMTVEDEKTISDSDFSEEELCFLPAFPCKTSEQSDESFTGITGQNRPAVDFRPNSAEETKYGASLKRQRKPSVKIMEFTPKIAKKPAKSMKMRCQSIAKTRTLSSITMVPDN